MFVPFWVTGVTGIRNQLEDLNLSQDSSWKPVAAAGQLAVSVPGSTHCNFNTGETVPATVIVC